MMNAEIATKTSFAPPRQDRCHGSAKVLSFPVVTTAKKPEPLLPKIAAGDTQAVDECLARYKGLVWWLARQYAPLEAEDAVQEIFIELWSNADRYKPELSSESAFISMVARRRLIDRRRKAGRRPTEESLEPVLWDESMSTDSDTVEAGAEVALATRAIRQLRPQEQKVLWLNLHQGLTHTEIAESLTMPLGTVKTYIRRGLIQVREMLERANLQEAQP